MWCLQQMTLCFQYVKHKLLQWLWKVFHIERLLVASHPISEPLLSNDTQWATCRHLFRFQRCTSRSNWYTAIIKIENGHCGEVKDMCWKCLLLVSIMKFIFLGFCIEEIHFVFVLPAIALKSWFPGPESPSHLAYVDWFTAFASICPGRDHGLYKVSWWVINMKQHSSIILIDLIYQSAHLIPAFGLPGHRAMY